MFLILTSPRTGSELLTSALVAHPDLDIKSEILNPHRYKEWRQSIFINLFGVESLPYTATIDKTVPVSTIIYDQTPQLAQFVQHYLRHHAGFKATYDQITRTSPVVELLESLPELKIIFMNRDHRDSAVSYWFAMRSQIWQVSSDKPPITDQPERVRPEFVHAYRQTAISDDQFYRALFKNHQTITVNYDDLVKQWGRTIDGVHRFLGLKPVPTEMPLRRRLNRPLNELVINWNELC